MVCKQAYTEPLAQTEEEDTQEEREGEGQEQQDEAGKSTMQK